MGWDNCHLHQFEITDPNSGMQESIGDGCVSLNGYKSKISRYFSLSNNIAFYEYDFGDSWEHKIMLEKILPINKATKYPVCIAGNSIMYSRSWTKINWVIVRLARQLLYFNTLDKIAPLYFFDLLISLVIFTLLSHLSVPLYLAKKEFLP